MRNRFRERWPALVGLGLCLGSSALVSGSIAWAVVALRAPAVERHETFDRRPSARHRATIERALIDLYAGPRPVAELPRDDGPEPALGPIAGTIPSAVDPIGEVPLP